MSKSKRRSSITTKLPKMEEHFVFNNEMDKAIKKSLDDMENGNVSSHGVVMKRIGKLLKEK